MNRKGVDHKITNKTILLNIDWITCAIHMVVCGVLFMGLRGTAVQFFTQVRIRFLVLIGFPLVIHLLFQLPRANVGLLSSQLESFVA